MSRVEFAALVEARERLARRREVLHEAAPRAILVAALAALGRRRRPRYLVAALAGPSRESAAIAALRCLFGDDEPWASRLAVAPVVERRERLDAELRREIRILDAQIRALAAHVRVEAGTAEYPIRTHYRSTYATQGWGADRYARGAADLEAVERDSVLSDEERDAGVRVEVEPVEWGYRVVARGLADRLDGIAIDQRPVCRSLPQQVADCWRRGVNPRVLNPWLPADFEARHGIGYDGSIRPKGPRGN